MCEYFLEDQWASGILGVKSYISKRKIDFDPQIIQEFKRSLDHEAFVTLKVDTYSIKDVFLLQKFGFNIVDTSIKYSVNPKNFNDNSKYKLQDSNYFIKNGKDHEKDDIAKIAYDEFKFSRFHLDPFFSKSIASKFKYEWVLNFFKGKRGDNLYIAKEKENGRILGFILLKDEKLKEEYTSSTTIDLLATNSNFNKRGVATSLVSFSIDKYINFREIYVGTQAVNIPANNLYQKLGFRMQESSYIFHYHHKYEN